MQFVVFSKKGQILLSFTSLNFICFQWIQFKFCVHLKVLETTNTNINIRELLPNTKWANKWLQTRSRYSYHALKSNSGKIFFGQIHPYSRYPVQNSVKGYPRWRNWKKSRAKEVPQWFTNSPAQRNTLHLPSASSKRLEKPRFIYFIHLNKCFFIFFSSRLQQQGIN